MQQYSMLRLLCLLSLGSVDAHLDSERVLDWITLLALSMCLLICPFPASSTALKQQYRVSFIIFCRHRSSLSDFSGQLCLLVTCILMKDSTFCCLSCFRKAGMMSLLPLNSSSGTNAALRLPKNAWLSFWKAHLMSCRSRSSLRNTSFLHLQQRKLFSCRLMEQLSLEQPSSSPMSKLNTFCPAGRSYLLRWAGFIMRSQQSNHREQN